MSQPIMLPHPKNEKPTMSSSRMCTAYARTKNFGKSRKCATLILVPDTTKSIDLAQPCSMNFWTFAIPVMLATAGSSGVSRLARKLFVKDHESVQEAAMFATKMGAFWLIAGFSWIAMCKRNGAKS